MANDLRTVHNMQFNVGRLPATPDSANRLLLGRHASDNLQEKHARGEQRLCSLVHDLVLQRGLRNNHLHQSSSEGETVHADESDDAVGAIIIKLA